MHPARHFRAALLLAGPLLALLAGGCAPTRGASPWSQVREVTPAFLSRALAADPSLALGPGGQVALTWVTRDSLGADAWLSTSTDSGVTWGTPVRLDARPGRVSSFPESRPVAAWGRDGMLVAAFPFVVSEALLAEYRAVLVRPGLRKLHGLAVAEVETLLTDIAQHAIVLAPVAAPPAPDPGDQFLWELLAAKADLLLVTGDKALLRDPGMQSRVVSPHAFVQGA